MVGDEGLDFALVFTLYNSSCKRKFTWY